MKNRQLRKWTLLSFFIILEIVMSFVPFLGFIPLGAINATTLHLPVIMAGIVLGRKEGAIVGFVFGCLSLFRATFTPNLTSFIFSPFISVGSISGQWTSLITVFVPRIFMGYISGLLMEKVKFSNDSLRVAISAFIAAISNTALVFICILVFFKQDYATAVGQSTQMLFTFLMGLLTSIGVIEAIVAVCFAIPIHRAVKHLIKGGSHA